MFDINKAKPDDIWDPATGETVGQALERFSSFGPEVPARDVPRLVRAGRTVWSFGYGDDPADFDTLTTDDISGWDPEEAYAIWGPFRLEHKEEA